jgi:hypothetical protein
MTSMLAMKGLFTTERNGLSRQVNYMIMTPKMEKDQPPQPILKSLI